MAVVITTATSGGYTVFSSVNAVLATAISEVINELETHHISFPQTQFVTSFDDTDQEYVFMAVCKKG